MLLEFFDTSCLGRLIEVDSDQMWRYYLRIIGVDMGNS